MPERKVGEWRREIYVELDVPEDGSALTKSVNDLQDGDRLYLAGKYYKVRAVSAPDTPIPEELQGQAEEIKTLTLQGKYGDAEEAALDFADLARKIQRGDVRMVSFQGSRDRIVVRDGTPVAVKDPKWRKPKYAGPPLKEIAARIRKQLHAAENDKEWNQYTWTDSQGRAHTQSHLYHSGAAQVGSKVRVTYVTYQGGTFLDPATALAYAEWLEAGNRGRHFTFQTDKAA